ncbi:MAG: helix-turn-helix domain-containing protein [Bilophila wadsworthia]|uniref:helix-turn-helix domain-containing protein n=1 Tax=Bilophila wadsworthia TaxID=35833 RepID=UPI002911E129|nr:helix-turn-helix domain-containing protein [Bilophila wadsworthia]MDU4374429.1 helix-turn-helix domain-containing protein [Bilophila wadsworthia]
MPTFIRRDPSVSGNASYLYEMLFDFCGDKDHCYPTQSTLALLCKTTVRSVQNYIAELTRTGYIAVRKDEKTGRNIYYLLLSEHLLALLRKLGIPTHGMQTSSNASARGAHEKFSHDIRVNKKQEITPLSPLPVQEVSSSPSCRNRTGHPGSAPLPQRVQGRGDFSSLSRTGAPQITHVLHRPTEHEFENLWAAWPQAASWAMPHNRQLALRVYRRMRRARQLPPIEKLLGIVEQYKLTDSRWLNGYPPELSNWLHSRQFEKAPLMRRPKKTFFGKLVPAEPVLTPEERRQAEVYRARIEELQKRFNQPTVSTSPTPSQDADALIALWPEPERQRVPVTTYLNYLSGKGQKPDLARLVSLARDYLSGTSSPMSLVGWLRSCQACAV